MRKRTINLVLLLAFLTFLFLTLTPLLLSRYVAPEITRRVLVQQVEHFFQKPVEVGRAGLTILGGLGVVFNDLRVLDSDGKTFFRVKALVLKPWMSDLIRGRLRWKRIILKNPSIDLVRTPGGRIELGSTWKKRSEGVGRGIFQRLQEGVADMPSEVFIRDGRVRLRDLGVVEGPVVIEIEEFEAECQIPSPAGGISIQLAGRFADGKRGEFSVSGKVIGLEESRDPRDLEFEVRLKAEGIDSQRLWPYVRPSLPLEKIQGVLDLDIAYTGGITSFHSSGEMRIREGHFAIPALYSTPVRPKEVSVAYELSYEKKEVHILQWAFRLPHLSIQGRGDIHGVLSADRSFSFEFTTDRASFQEVQAYFPDGLVPERLRPFLTKDRIRGGLRIEKARFQGTWASLTSQGLLKGAETLSIRARLDGCTFLPDPKLPPVRKISGVVTFDGKEARLTGFRGEFLRSRFYDLRGSISQIDVHPRLDLAFKGDLDLKGLFSLLKAGEIPGEIQKAVDPIAGISGNAKVTGQIEHHLGRPADLSFKGTISLRRTDLKLAHTPLSLTGIEGEIGVDEKEIRFSHFKWKIGKIPWRGQGSVREYLKKTAKKLALSKGLKVVLGLRARELNLDRLLSRNKTKGTIRIDPKSFWVNSTVRVAARVDRGSVMGFRFSHLNTSLTLKRGHLRLWKLQATAPGGFVRLRGWLNLRAKRGVSFKLVPNFHRLDLAHAIPISSGPEKRRVLSGVLSLDGLLVGGGTSWEDVIGSLQGYLRLRAAKGQIYGLQGLKGKGLPFDRVSAQILIRRGIARTDDLVLNGESFNMSIKGRADLKAQSLDIRIGVRPMETVDKVLSNIPVAGWLLAGKDRSILTFSYRVRGKFNDLRLTK